MRLESIKLAGFKSFVDPTTLAFPSNLTAIVGPNGCGKSNIIDAIRWVMGESSAKQLRGQSLDDVIFNGCTTRKPLGQAAIELNFDNSDGSLGGKYSSYAQISIRREITREGQSIYYLNGSRCRRRDIRDIFLGTGLGPRSYAIIEQGMISRVVEAKPDELRAYIEEAAGISKYKERRRETENRLEHTQENLNRLNDLREELAKQAKHLQRQANAAERYKNLKEEERLLKARLQALRYRTLNNQLQSQLIAITETEGQLNETQGQQQTLLKELNQDRDQQNVIRTDCDVLQSRYYELGNEITRLEEKLRSQTAQFKQNQQEESELSQKNIFLDQQSQENQALQNHLNQEIAILHKDWTAAQKTTAESQTALKQSEQDLKNCQLQWEEFQAHVAQLTQQNRVAQTQHQHYQQQSETLKKRIERLEQEQTEQNQVLSNDKDIADLTVALTESQQKQADAQLEQTQTTQQINAQRLALQQLAKELDHCKSQLQKNQGHTASLMALQQEALGQREESLLTWLKKHNLNEHPRLAQLVQVETGWERAVEVALNQHIQAVCFTDRDSLDDFFQQSLPDSSVSLMAKSTPCEHTSLQFESQLPLPRLSTKLTAPWPLDNLLAGVYVAETLSEALTHSKQLKGYESIITREGVCLGNHWLSLSNNSTVKTGLLQREREINTLKKEQNALQAQIDTQQTDYTAKQKQLKELEEKLVEKQKQLSEVMSCQADLKARHQVKEARLSQAKQRMQRIQQELQENKAQCDEMDIQWQQVRHDQISTQTQLDEVQPQREALLENKAQLQKRLSAAAEKAKTDETQRHQLELRKQTAEHQFKTLEETITRLQQQQTRLKERVSHLQQTLEGAENPLLTIKQQLDSLSEQRHTLASELKQSQTILQDIEQRLKRKEQQTQSLETDLSLDRDDLEQRRLQCQELRVRAKTLEEQLHEQAYEVETLLNELPDEADISNYETQLREITRHIEQIGAVNLAALEEHQSVSERKIYLDAQHHDLEQALETLKTAIQKMDKETRSRFKETFDKINQNFKDLFPRLFSGGEASLQLQDPDLLSSGICIMAQPPGKRNSSIQLLSGGEKALTATALVFSFFQLNPAPFCMLDEVDAPLDDTNVLRFCKLVKEMATDVQFIFISHNKVAIEMAQHLAGVTMHEPGVSRLVTVDIEKAIAIASA
ncbi:chromosome segregation protein SMC [Rickettsiella endosymbiont of Dermanyssus gallinae]|uniref:chromosome segregation protein SMC n=1 Tax=Rickettsiella endosymbiont of Dermanyssus gallinae TaxID=2856608 RepID=UPI001C532CE7|nr:chromosome segregation protein SMC [Rickettsiella endosymbiont of Dermanyssus gallinae]